MGVHFMAKMGMMWTPIGTCDVANVWPFDNIVNVDIHNLCVGTWPLDDVSNNN